MYVPAAFTPAEPAALRELMSDYGFATLVSGGAAGLVASHVPVLYDPDPKPKGRLFAHLARANPHAKALDGAEVLAIFQGPHGYVSPSWYATHPAVPTWNYAAVHVYGRARLVTDETQLRAIVQRLVDKYESGRPAPWSMAGVPERYTHGMLAAIVGVEVDIARIEGKHKLSQNRDAEDRRRVIATLEASADPNDRLLAAYMSRHAPPG
jgi:transcriptional regulator